MWHLDQVLYIYYNMLPPTGVCDASVVVDALHPYDVYASYEGCVACAVCLVYLACDVCVNHRVCRKERSYSNNRLYFIYVDNRMKNRGCPFFHFLLFSCWL